MPQILINRDPVAHHQFDVVLLGDGDGIVRWLCEALARAESGPSGARGGGGGKVRPGEKEGGRGEEDEKARERERDETARRWDLDRRVPVQLPVHARSASPAKPEPSTTASISTNGTAGPALAPHEPSSPTSTAAAEPDPDAVPSLPSLPASAHPPASAASTTVPERVGDSHVWLFPGANRESRWVRAVREAYGPDGAGEGEGAARPGGADGSSEDDDEDEDEGAGRDEQDEEERRRAEDGEDAPVELPTSLAPGAAEGLPSDEESDAAGLSDDEGGSGAQLGA